MLASAHHQEGQRPSWRHDGFASSGSGWGSHAVSDVEVGRQQHKQSRTESPSLSVQQQQMGGVGLVFYREGNSPYLIVKDVVHDGPAFRSSLVYPGDKLCCINDFDLAWSDTTPRTQQPQLPGSHGSAVSLTFDRSVDSSRPERFTLTLVRNMACYPDRLSSTPSRLTNNHSSHAPPDSSQLSSPAQKREESRNTIAQKHGFLPRPEARSVTRSAAPDPVLSPDLHAYSSGWPQLEQTPQHRNAQQQQDKLPSQLDAASIRHRSISPGQMRSMPDAGYPYDAGSNRNYDSYSASQTSDLDEIIQEIARNDQILELQQKLSSGEIEHEKQIKDFQRNQAVLEGMVKSLRSEMETARKRSSELERQLGSKDSAKHASANIHEAKVREMQSKLHEERKKSDSQIRGMREDREKVIRERDAALNRMSVFEKDVRVHLQQLQGELERERARRQQLEQKYVDATVLRQVQTEKELLERQNEDLTRQLIELKMLLRTESQHGTGSAQLQMQVHSQIDKPVATRGFNPARQPTQDILPADDMQIREIPGLQMDSVGDLDSSRMDSKSEDVELHQSPSSAGLNNLKVQDDLTNIPSIGSPKSTMQGRSDAEKPFMSPQPQLISQQPVQPRYQLPDLASSAAKESQRETPIIPKLNLPRPTVPSHQKSSGVRAGIGMSFHPDPSSGRFIISDVHPNGPAGQAVAQGSLIIGDALLAVNGSNIKGKTVPDIIEEILGPEGTSVLLTIARSYHGEMSNQTVTLSLIRARPGERVKSQNDSRSTCSPSPPRAPTPTSGRSNGHSKSSSPKPSPKTSPGAGRVSPKSTGSVVLPAGWVVEVDPSSGRTYYVNHTLKTFSWARPENRSS